MPAVKRKERWPALIELGGSDTSASEYIASKPTERARKEERRVLEHLAHRFAGTPCPPPAWPRSPRGFRINLDAVPWSRLSPELLRAAAERQHADVAPGPVRARDLQADAPGESLRRRRAAYPKGVQAARRRVYALRHILECAHRAGRLSTEKYLERYAALRGL